MKRLLLLLIGAQLSALALTIALYDRADARAAQGKRRVRDPRVTVPWEGRA